MKRFFLSSAMFVCFVALASTSLAGTYSDRVISLNPTYYYQLNETDTSAGVVDTMGNGPVGSYNGDYEDGVPEVGIPGPDFLIEGGRWTVSEEWDDLGDEIDIIGLDSDNVAHASNNEGHITLGDGEAFASNSISVAMFALGGKAQGGDRLFTNNVEDPLTSFQIVVGNDGIVVSTNPTVGCFDEVECGHRSLFFPDEGIEFTNQGADRGLNGPENGWWHIVATTEGDTALDRTENIRLWLNGVDRTEDMLPGTVGWGTNTGLAKIGGRRANAADTTTHSGAQDEVSIWLDRVLSDEEALSLYEAAISDEPIGAPGDFDGDGQLTALDIDLLSDAVLAGDNKSQFDLNSDSLVNQSDREVWVDDLKSTYFGDSNLDGEFNSTDFVAVFTEGKYEDGVAANAGWASGDWNGDKEFDSSDFVAAFVAGGYEIGPRQVAVVPEPSALVLFAIGLLVCLARRR